MARVRLINVEKRYGDVAAVAGVDLDIAEGEFLTLLGPSGCGKTTTLRMIAGHETVSEGDIILGAENVTDRPPAARGTAMMFQSFALFPHLSALDNVAFSLKMKGVAKAERHAKAIHAQAKQYRANAPAEAERGEQKQVLGRRRDVDCQKRRNGGETDDRVEQEHTEYRKGEPIVFPFPPARVIHRQDERTLQSRGEQNDDEAAQQGHTSLLFAGWLVGVMD